MNKVFVKNKGNEGKYIDADKVDFGDMTFQEVKNEVLALHQAYNNLAKVLKNNLIVPKDTPLIINVDGRPKRIDSLQVFNDGLDRNLKFYKIVDNKLVIDKERLMIL